VKITYATMSAEDDELHAAYDAAVAAVRSRLGADHPFVVAGDERRTGDVFEERSPVDSDLVVGTFSLAGPGDVDDAVAAARGSDWGRRPWEERAEIIRRAGDVIEGRMTELAALIGFEVGKSRLEALGDVAETVEFCRYYPDRMEEADGFTTELGRLSAAERNVSVLRPHGVWAVVSPFNFPAALAGGPAVAALLTGNTVVLKPSRTGTLAALELRRCLAEAGVPADALHVVTGGEAVGDALVHHPGVGGVTFTGSHAVGMGIYRSFATRYPKPVVAEMGGKNPTIVTATADLAAAAEGVARAAFGFSGQKCSACSRVYVDAAVHDRFLDALAGATSRLTVGNPLERGVFTGPVIDGRAVDRFEAAVADVASRGGRIVTGGTRLRDGDLARGNFLDLTVATVTEDSPVWREEIFVPFVVVAPVSGLDEALARANDSDLGLCAGLFTGDPADIARFQDAIEAGVTYVNRRAGATTGAWPGIQSFGGWKGSGSSGAGGGGPWYLRSYLREQSRTVVTE